MEKNSIPFENWFKREYASDKLCFLCGTELSKGKYTREHIFPQWILNLFNLWDKSIILLNKVPYHYNRSVVPCCNTCNNNHLSQLESEIRNGVEQGYHFFTNNIPPIRIYQWCQLIFYKWLFKETFFRENIKDPLSKKIVPPLNFNWMILNHLLLRSIDKEITFENFFPGSIFICHLKTSADPTLNFDYSDDVLTQCLSIRMNDIGIIAILADSDLQKSIYAKSYRDILSHQLAPIQFRNLFIQMTYVQTLFRDPFNFHLNNITENSLSLTQKPKEGFEGLVYGEWNDEIYLQFLSSAFRADLESMRVADGKAGSFFYDSNGKWKERSFEDMGLKE